MNLNDILKGNKNEMDKYAAFYASQSSGFSSGAAMLTRNKRTLKKLKMKTGNGLMVIPMMIHLGISFSGEPLATPVPVYGSFETAIKLIKFNASSKTLYNETLKDLLGDEDYAKLNLSSVDTVSNEEKEVFRRFRHPLVYAKTVMSVKDENGKYAFGRPYAVELAQDPDTKEYIDNPNNPLIWKLHRLETACLAAKVKQLREDNESLGDKKRTEKELNDTIKTIWENRCISNPYSLGTTRVLFFDADRNFEITPELKNGWSKDKVPGDHEFYIKINQKFCESLEGYIGSKYDRYDDFLLIKQTTPAFDQNTMASAARDITRTAASSDEAIEKMLPEFIEGYATYRDNIEAWDDKVIKTSAFEYKTISDQAIADIFKNSMPGLAAPMKTEEIANAYSETIAALDSNLSDEIMSSIMTGEAPSVGDISKEIAEAPVVTEDTPGFNEDISDTDEASTADIISALMKSE